jgi:putative colanic acid biosynthesis UDP-glucose lipid carrier transferase
MTSNYAALAKTINIVVDYLILNLCLIIAYYIVDHSLLTWILNKHYLPTVLIVNLLWLLASNLTHFYENVLNKDSVKTFRTLLNTYLIFIGFICFFVLFIVTNQNYAVTRQFFFYGVGVFSIILFLWKVAFLSYRRSERNLLTDIRNIVIVGGGKISNDLFNYISANPEKGYRLKGIFDDDEQKVYNSLIYLGKIDDCIPFTTTNNIQEIFCTLPNSYSTQIEHLMGEADKNLIRFKLVPDYFYVNKPTFVENFGHIPMISLRLEPLENMLNRFVKRLFDILFSLFVILFIFSWLLPILCILVKFSSPGPIFFVQVRSGRNNEPFRCLKFRSMTINENSDHLQATRNDTRITKIGAILRKTNLDELPQFFNVLTGNMTVVGPRPHMLKHTQEYAQLIDSFMVRHFLKPGITGWAQVNGLRGETKTTDDMLLRVKADVWYLENWSFLLDLKIIFLTLWNTVKGEKNAF